MEPLLLISHAFAGDADDLAPALEILGARTSVEVAETSNPGELDGVLHRAGSRPIVVAGGDASLHAVIATLHRRNDLAGKVLGLLPLGAAGEFARTVGLPAEPEAAAEALLAGIPRPMDLIVDELGEVVVDSVHLGAGEHRARSLPLPLGVLTHPVGLLRSLLRPPALRLRVEVDGEVVADVDRQLLGLSVAGPADGEVDVTLSFASGPLRLLGSAGDLHRRGSRVSVTGEDFWISADGEVSGPERRRTWHVEPGAYSLLLPAEGDRA